MESVAQALVDAFVAAYRPYVEIHIESAGWPSVGESIGEGEEWLAGALSELLALPFALQRRSPLELFQEAMRFPTEALDRAGVAAVSRDEVAAVALPGDRFALAPASSQDLGEVAWRAHLQWGVAKAASVRPSAVLVSRNLIDRSRIEDAAVSAGYRIDVVAEVPVESRWAIGLVDLEHLGADAAIRELSGSAGRVIAFGPHVDDMAMARARSLGAHDALPRSRFFRDLGAWFPQLQ
ncbi:MAG: hypothetical protein WEE36_04300 [Acidimicrobiia bacterium]